MALTGTLEDVPLDELSSLLQQQRRTGTLKLNLGDGVVSILFRDGMICQVDDSRRPPGLLIGELLVEGQLITRMELANALEEQRSTTKPLGAILVGMGVVQIGDLAKRLEIQFRESLYPLYAITRGSFEFDPASSIPRALAPPPIPVEDVAMEAVRRIDELPGIEALLPQPMPPFMRMPDRTELPDEGARTQRLTERERKVFMALAQGGSIEQLVGQTCLSSFDIKKALAILLKEGLVMPVSTGGTPGNSMPHVAALVPQWFHPGRKGARVAFQAFFTLVLAIALLALGLQLFLSRPRSTEGGVIPFDTPFSALRQFVTQNHLLRLEMAAELYRLQAGSYPPNLTALVSAELLDETDLVYPGFDQEYTYRPSGEGYLLLPPKR